MKQLENLKEIADRNLGGLKADARLLQQIRQAAVPQTEIKIKWRPIAAAAAAAVVLLAVGLIALPQLMRGDGGMDVVSRSAGGEKAVTEFQLTANVPAGSVRISDGAGSAPSYRSLFAGQSSNFPLIKSGNETYRQLTDPGNLSADLLGEQLGKVAEFTSEPAVSSGGIVSNAVEAGQPVYTVKGMKGVAVAAEVQGSMRVFQRVSYGGVAVVGSEGLRDVLLGSAQVVAMELSGVGVVDQKNEAQELMNVLLQNANYEGAAESANRSQSLLIWLSNGLTVQMNAGGGTLSACGTWSCPEFFSAFSDAVSK